ncbi:hypothetical protein OIU74_027201 [Salix koriyanagi]|uniref:Uncharacterized protein n=1 Tax=Salix koriyanagi TaxID=2511006 RepID=A0A9Q1A4W5_9ROSI|nr:hypothetical protein OIU74_027201 [Salix koriyanagi]
MDEIQNANDNMTQNAVLFSAGVLMKENSLAINTGSWGPHFKTLPGKNSTSSNQNDAYQVSASLNALASADFKLKILPIASCPSLSSNCTLKEADSRIQTFILLLYVF